MKRATVSGTSVRPATVPALVLCAVLLTSAEAARAGGEPVAPFPGRSVSGTSVPGTSVPGAVEDGGGKSADVAPLPLGGGAASPAARPNVRGAAAGDETTAADAGADVPAAAAAGVDEGPSGAAVPDAAMVAAKPATPAGGSRLLRALAELPETLVPKPGGVPGEAARPGTARVFAAEGCPRALLRRLLAGAAGEADALSALGIEREILTLCRERQEILAGLFEAEARLSELREARRGPETPVPAAGAAPAPRVEAPVETAPVETTAPSPLRAALGGAAETLVPETLVPGKANEADTRAADTSAADPRAAEPQGNSTVRAPRYAWFSIIGTAGALRAAVTDGTGVWFVREGDPLPGGATVAAIAGRPPGVRVTGAGESGEAALLPFRALPGGAP